MADDTGGTDAAEALIETRRGISLVWLVPIVAVVIGGWLAYSAFAARGPSVTIAFESASGLTAGKTLVKYKDVVIGLVEAINLVEDLSHVEVQARLNVGSTRYLTENTRFWVVRAQVSAGRVSGLGTLLSGAYIGMDPSTEGARRREFVGLERPPVVTHDQEGRLFDLRGADLGSVDVGAPVYYRWLDVGRVAATELDESGEYTTIQVFIRAPHHKRVGQNTSFWNASGIDVSLSPEGFEIDTVSLTSILIGGIAFETPGGMPGEPAPEHTRFTLYRNKRATTEPELTVSRPFLLHFEQSAGGLVQGAPVEFRGIQIGEVRDVRMVQGEDDIPRIPVIIAIQPERVGFSTKLDPDPRARWQRMVSRGLRAQLKTANILTGKLAISLDFHPDAEPAEMNFDGPIPELPTIPSSIEALTSGVTDFVNRLGKLPLEEIGADLRRALQSADRVLVSADGLVARDSDTAADLRRVLRELADAARATRLLADHLERHPEDLLRGKGASE